MVENRTAFPGRDGRKADDAGLAMVIRSTGHALRMSDAEVRLKLEEVMAENIEVRLNRLHEIELTWSDAYDWPWKRWKKLGSSGYAPEDIIPSDYFSPVGEELSPLAMAILEQAAAVHRSEPQLQDMDSLFGGKRQAMIEKIKELESKKDGNENGAAHA